MEKTTHAKNNKKPNGNKYKKGKQVEGRKEKGIEGKGRERRKEAGNGRKRRSRKERTRRQRPWPNGVRGRSALLAKQRVTKI